MKIIAIYREESDHAREVIDFIHDFEKRIGFDIEIRNPDNPDNQFFLQAYDIVEYPTIIAIENDGRMLQMWRGRPLPRIDEVSYYAD